MSNSNLYSQYYIGTGADTKMYTLRHQFEEKIAYMVSEGQYESAIVMRDFYLHNLSTDAKKAVEKAQAQGYDCAEPQFTLEEIQRREAGEAQAERDLAEERFRTTQQMKLDEEILLIQEHRFPFGRNIGSPLKKLVEEKGEGWAAYWMKDGRTEDTTATVTLLGKVLESLYPEVAEITFLDKSGNGQYFGKIGVRQKLINVRCVEYFSFEGFYGYVNVIKFLTDSGELLMYMGAADIDCEVGERLVVSFGIKSQEVYKGDYQTVVQRVKVNVVKG